MGYISLFWIRNDINKTLHDKAKPFLHPIKGREWLRFFYGIGGGYRYDASNVMEVVRKCKYAEA